MRARLLILAAAILNSAGIGDRLFGFAHALVGHIRGGLGQGRGARPTSPFWASMAVATSDTIPSRTTPCW